VFDMACFLLKMMRLQEHALRPHDLAAPRHLKPRPIAMKLTWPPRR